MKFLKHDNAKFIMMWPLNSVRKFINICRTIIQVPWTETFILFTKLFCLWNVTLG